MNLLELVATLSLNSASYEKGLDQAHSDANAIGAKIGNAFKTMGKVALAGLGAAAAGVSALAKSSVEAYANYEQLVGGVDTLFKDSSKLVQEYAANAYKTAGLSANDYMETVTGFSASLLQSLGGDTEAAAQVANRAITDMSDNANKMGTSMEMIQNAYGGFAKQNYTMLDNLKLGYGGTKEEMARLIEDASKLTDVQKELGITVDGTDMSFGNIVNAISVMQKKMDIAGTTAKEAGTTIAGSVGQMKSAWTNLIAEVAKPEGDIGSALNNLFTSIVGDGSDTNKGVLGNLMPVIEQTLTGIGQALQTAAPILAEQFPVIVDALLPPLLSAAMSLINGLVESLPTILQTLIAMLPGIVNTILTVLVNNLPMLIEFGLQAIITLANGIAAALPTLIPQIVNVILTVVDTLINNIDALIDASIAIMTALGDGLIEALPTLIEKIPEIVVHILKSLIKNAPKLLEAGAELLLKIWSGLLSGFGKLVQAGADIVAKVKEGLKEKIDAAKEWGHDLISNFIGGIKEKWNALKETVSGVGQKIKDFIGFSEPKEGPLSNFHTYAPDMMDLFIKGINDNKSRLAAAVSNAFDFEDYIIKNPVGSATSNSNTPYSKGGERVYNYTVNVNQPVSTPDEMARVIRTESQYGLIIGEAL